MINYSIQRQVTPGRITKPEKNNELTCAGCRNEAASRDMDCCWDCNRNPRRKNKDLYRRKF